MGDRLNFTDGTQIRDTFEVLQSPARVNFLSTSREKKCHFSESTYDVSTTSAVYFSYFNFIVCGVESIL